MTAPRPAREDDLAAVVELVARANVADVGLRDTRAEEIRDEWAAPGFESWVVPGDALVAYASLAERSAGCAYLDVYVDPPARGRGLETKLVRILEARMRERGLSGANAFAVTPEMGSVLEREGFRLTRQSGGSVETLAVRPGARRLGSGWRSSTPPSRRSADAA